MKEGGRTRKTINNLAPRLHLSLFLPLKNNDNGPVILLFCNNTFDHDGKPPFCCLKHHQVLMCALYIYSNIPIIDLKKKKLYIKIHERIVTAKYI